MFDWAAAATVTRGLTCCLIAAAAWTARAAPVAGAEGKAGLRGTVEKTSVLVHAGKELLLEYRYADVPRKPYVKRLLTPGGLNLLRDAPHDHLHHHGVMFAVAAGGVDFWSEGRKSGRQVHRAMDGVKVERRGGQPMAVFTEQLDWLSADGKTALQERRTIHVCRAADAEATLLTWRGELVPPPGGAAAKLTGSHYFGLGMRWIESMDKVGRFRLAGGRKRESGTHVRGDEYVTPAAWCAYTCRLKDKAVTAAMFGHPENYRGATHWFTMRKPFAYLSATINLWKQPATVQKSKPLALRYAVVLWDGQVTAERIGSLYRQWSAWFATRRPKPSKRSDQR